MNNQLPEKIAIFPLSNAIFFPKTVLPLNIFEKRYIQMVEDSMKKERLFGMIQPKIQSSLKPEVYNVGCLGKIIDFNETKDKRFVISLSGVSRFRVKEEIKSEKLYREFKVDYSDFVNDLKVENIINDKYDFKDLFKKIKFYLKKKNYLIEFEELEKLSFDQYINTICMIAPFSIGEKQKLMEAIKFEDKANILKSIITINMVEDKNKTIQ